MLDHVYRRNLPIAALLALAAGVAACGGENGGGPADASAGGDDMGVTAQTRSTFGAACSGDADCDAGLFCFRSEAAPVSWCAATCETERQGCRLGADSKPAGWCVTMPAGFAGEPKRFCQPICRDLFGCQALGSFWETCADPSFKGNPVYGTTDGVRTCQAPSSHGKATVDPATCAGWEDSYAKEHPSQVNICKLYCDYLRSCGTIAPSAYNAACCAFGCYLEMTPQGKLNTVIEKRFLCHSQAYSAFRGTKLACSEPESQCGAPHDPTPTP